MFRYNLCALLTISSCMLMALSSVSVTAQIAVSTFDTGINGWTVVDRNPVNYQNLNSHSSPVFQSSGGNPGGYIQASDEDGEWYWSAPAEFLGNKSIAYNGMLTFDINFQSGIDVPPDPHGLIISGSNITFHV